MFDVFGLDVYKQENDYNVRFVILDLETKYKEFVLLDIHINLTQSELTLEFFKKVIK